MIFGVTGHRKVEQQPGELDQFARLTVARMKNDGCSLILTGMALGWDQAVAQAAVEHGIGFAAMIPFPNQHQHWTHIQQQEYQTLLSRASLIRVEGRLALNKYYIDRDKRIVRSCECLWALDSGRRGGTRATVLFAESYGRKVVPLWEDWLHHRAERK